MRPLYINLCAIVIILFFTISCQTNKNLNPVKKAVGAVWIAEPKMEFIDFALKQDIRLSLIFHITNARTPEIDSWIQFIKEAQRNGVKLRVCPIPDGYDEYINTIDAVPQLAIVSNFLRLLKSEGVKPFELILDAEGRSQNLIQNDFNNFLQTGSVNFLHTIVDKIPTQAEHAAALLIFQNFINNAHNDGWKVGITTLDMVSSDTEDNDNDFERFLAIPLRGVNWDFITYQVYRTIKKKDLGSIKIPYPSSYCVYHVAKLAHDEFGDKAGVDIGLMGVGQLPVEGDYKLFSDW